MKSTDLTNSRKIGTFYLVFACFSGVVGVLLSLAMKFDIPDASVVPLAIPFLSPVSLAHALVMIVFMMVPALFCGFANWLIPMMIGTADMQFARLNLVAFWLLPVGFILLLTVFFLGSMFFAAVLVTILALHIVALSFLLTAINFIATILACRTPLMSLVAMRPFVWSVLIAAFLVVMFLPVMSAALTLLLGKLAFGAAVGGDILVRLEQGQNLPVMTWFFTHPELFILMLPAFGIVSEVIATFSGGRLVMDKSVKGAMGMIGVVGFIFWSQNILTGDEAVPLQDYFLLMMVMMGLPFAVILSAWLISIWRVRQNWPTPILWTIGFICMMLVAILSLSGKSNTPPPDINSFVIHFHYMLALGGVFAIFAGWYFWFGKISGYQIRDFSGKLHFWSLFIGVHLTFLPLQFGHTTHLPSSWRVPIDISIAWQYITAFGAFFSALSLFFFFYAACEAFVRKRPAGANPWGAGAVSLEWQLASPPPAQGNTILVPVPSRAMP